MAIQVLMHALNIGVVDKDKLHRVDLERLRLAAEDQTNLLCDAVGRAFLRPGTQHLVATKDGAKARLVDFVAGQQQAYALELTDSALRVLNGDSIVTRPAVVTTVQNGDFSAAPGWTLGTNAGTLVAIASGLLRIFAFASKAYAFARQQVAVAPADQGVEHALRISVLSSPIMLRVGSTSQGQEYIRETVLRPGMHSLAFIPTGNFWIELSGYRGRNAYVDSCQVEAAGAMVLPTPWELSDLQNLRLDQSLDVLFVACDGKQQKRIESRGNKSWSVCNYETTDGPFLVGGGSDVRLQSNTLEGNGQLTSNRDFFTPGHVGALFRIYHDGQKVDTYLAGDDTYTKTIMVTGINEPDYNERDWSYTISGTWAGTLRVQRSFDGDDVQFHPFRREQGSPTIDITANGSFTNDDNEDNAIAYYRIGFEPGTYTSGAARIQMTYDGGGGYGICVVTGYISPTQVSIEVLKPFQGLTPTTEWREGAWSGNVGWPAAGQFHEGRLWWLGYDAFWGSISDAYDSFDEDFVGDAGPIARSIAIGGRNDAKWGLSLSQFTIGTNTSIVAIRASSLEEIMTPENTAAKRISNVGSAGISPALLADDRALFVEASGTALYEINYDPTKGRALATEFSKLTTELFSTGITGLAVQDRPDQRIWVTNVSADAVCWVFEPQQEVVAPIPISTSAASDVIESIITLPGVNGQDRVLMSVARLVDGVTTRRIERLALDREAVPATITKCLDAHVVFGAGSALISGLGHLIGRTVWAWVDGKYVEGVDGTPTAFVVSGAGTITLPSVPVTGGCAGLPYRGRYKSPRLEYGQGSTSMLKKKTLAEVGILFADYCRSGVKIGTEFDNADHPLRPLPQLRGNTPVTSDIVVGPDKDEPLFPLLGEITFDTRLCIEVTKPAAILALVLSIENYGG